jgi:hypothetical protein
MTALVLSRHIAAYTLEHDLSPAEAQEFGKIQAILIARSAFEVSRVEQAMRYGEYEGHDSAALARSAD